MHKIIVGGGIVGLAAAYEAEKAGDHVLLIEDGNPQGSAGDTRIFRTLHAEEFLKEGALRALRGWQEWGQNLLVPRSLWARVPWQSPDIHDRHPLLLERGDYFEDRQAAVGMISRAIRFLEGEIQGERRRTKALRVRGNRVWLENGEELVADHIIVAAGISSRELLGLDPRPLLEHVRFSFEMREPATVPLLIDKTLGFYGLPDGELFALGMPVCDQPVQKNKQEFIAQCQERAEDLVRKHMPGLIPRAQNMIYYVYPEQSRDGPEIARGEGWTALSGQNLFKFAPWLGKCAAQAPLDK